MGIKLKKIQAGLYETLDKRFRIQDMYAPDAAHRGYTGSSPKWWKIQTTDGSKVFRVILPTKKEAFWEWKQVDTLQEAREALENFYRQEEKNKIYTVNLSLTSEQLQALSTVLYNQSGLDEDKAIELLDMVSRAQNELLCLRNGWEFNPDADRERSLALTGQTYRDYRSGRIKPYQLF